MALAIAAALVLAPLALAAPANDDFVNATAMPTALPASEFGNNSEATKEAGEPDHAGNPGGHSVWFSWTPSTSGPVSLTGGCFGLNALLAVYTGSAVDSLTAVASNQVSGPPECFGEHGVVEFTADAGTTYRIAVDGRDGAQGSFELRLNPPPENDDFDAATSITGELPLSLSGSTRLAGKQTGEPDHAGEPASHSVWYSWTPSFSGPVIVSTCSPFSPLDALLAIYTGSSVDALTQVAANDDSPTPGAFPECSGTDSEVRLDVSAGTTYRIAVDAAGGKVGRFNLRLRGRPANDDFADPQVLAPSVPAGVQGNNQLATKEAGEPDHAGDPGGHSVWFSWTSDRNGPMRISTCGSQGNSETLLAVYTGTELDQLTEVASNEHAPHPQCGSSGSEVVFDASEGTTYMIAVDGKDGDGGIFTLGFEAPPANDDFADAKALTGLPVSVSGSNRVASKEPGEPDHAGDPGGDSVWYSWTAPSTGPVAVSTCPYLESSPDTLLAVYAGTDLGNLTEVASNDDSPAACRETGSEVEIQAEEGTTYWIAVDGKGGDQGTFSLDLEGRPENDDFADSRVLAPEPIAPGGTTVLATKEAGEPDHAGNPGGHSVWFSWTPEIGGPVDLTACGRAPGVDTLLAVYTGSQLANLSPVASNDDAGSKPPDERCEDLSGASEISFEAAAGTTYRIAVDTKDGAGQFALDLERAPANDDFASAKALEEGLPAYGSANTKLATKQAGEPDHGGNPGGHSVWFKWTPGETESVSVATCTYKTSLDTLLAVYTGSELDSLTPVASSDDGQAPTHCRSSDSAAEFTAAAGTTYWFAVDGKGGSSGPFQLFLEGAAPNDDFEKSQSLGGGLPTSWQFASNRFATEQSGEPEHAGAAGGSSVWFKWTAPRSGTVGVDTCGSGFDTLLAVYTGTELANLTPVASNDDGSGSCAPQSRLTFPAVANTKYRIAVDGKDGAQGPLVLYVDSSPKNDDFAAAESIPGSLGWYWPGSNVLATGQTGEPGGASAHSVWYSWTPQKAWTVEIDACASGFEPLLGVYTGAAVDDLTPVTASNAGAGECEEGRSVRFTTTAGATYRIAVDGAAADEGHFELHLRPANAVMRSLSVVMAGTGTGSVTSGPAGISCGTTCKHDFSDGAQVTLTASPATGSSFAGWSGGGCSGTGPCQITLEADTTASAIFEAVPASSGGGGGGAVVVPAAATPKPPPKKPPLRCKRGFVKKKVHGKQRCVRKKIHKKHRHRGSRKAG
jgi:hypothetical protein